MKQWLGECWADALVVLKICIVVAIPTALLLSHVWNQYRITDLGYQIAEVTSEHRYLLEENKKLTVEAGLQGRSDRVSEVARHQFGLEQLRPEQIITVELADDERAAEHARVDALQSGSQQNLP